MLIYDKLNLKCKEQCFPMNNSDLFTQSNNNKSEYFVRIQHTYSGRLIPFPKKRKEKI
jgi:hypothetical protein